MSQRLDYNEAAPNGMKALGGVYGYVSQSGLPALLVDIVYLRVSQINGCAFCIDMHTRDAMKAGETPTRLLLLDAWHEAPLYSKRERAALAWTEALTLIAQTHAPDADWDALKAEFSDEEIVKLSLLVATINAWNRLAIGFRAVPTGK